MRFLLGGLVLLSACTAESGLLLEPPATPGGAGIDGGQGPDGGPGPDPGRADGGSRPGDGGGPGPRDGGGPLRDAGVADLGVETCEPFRDVLVASGARISRPPHLTVQGGFGAIAWQSAAGVEGVLVDAQGQFAQRVMLGHPNARDAYLFRFGFEINAFFVEQVGDQAYVRRVIANGADSAFALGPIGETRLAAERGPLGEVYLLAVSPTESSLHELRGAMARYGVVLDPAWAPPPVSEAYPSFSLRIVPGNPGTVGSNRYLAAWDPRGIAVTTIGLDGGGGRELLAPPAGATFWPGFVATGAVATPHHLAHGVAAAVSGTPPGSVTVLHYAWPLYQSQVAPTVIATGRSREERFSIASHWAPELGAHLFAFPAAESGSDRQIYLAGLNEEGSPWPAPGAFPARPVSRAPSGDAIYPSLAWLGDQVAIVYLTDQGEVRLAMGRPCVGMP